MHAMMHTPFRIVILFRTMSGRLTVQERAQVAARYDFFLCGWAKDQVYKTKPRTVTQLQERIHEVIINVPLDFYRRLLIPFPFVGRSWLMLPVPTSNFKHL